MPELQEQIHDYRCALLPPHYPLSHCFCDVYVCLSVCVEWLYLSYYMYHWCRTKRTLGLGSLYGENDLLDLDGDPQRERQVAEKQLAALGEIL